MKYCFVIFLFLWIPHSFAQNYSTFIDIFKNKNITDTSSIVNISALENIGSNGINTHFQNLFLYRAESINETDKDNVSENLSLTRLGYDLTAEVNYIRFSKTLSRQNKIGYLIGLRYFDHIDAKFTKNLFDLAFYGNNHFAGKKINLTPFNFNLLNFYQLKFGILKIYGADEKDHLFYIGLSLLSGIQQAFFSAYRASLFTENEGKYVDFDIGYFGYLTDTLYDFSPFKGVGASTDFFISYNGNYNGTLFGEIQDFGIIHWNKKPYYYFIDSTYHWDGWEIDNIFVINDSIFNPAQPDSMIEKFTQNYSRESYTSILPALFNVGYIREINNFVLTFGAKARILCNYKPYVYLKSSYNFNKMNFSITPIFSYGGYDNFSFGLEIHKRIKNSFIINIGSYSIDGFILPMKATSQGVYVSVSKMFY